MISLARGLSRYKKQKHFSQKRVGNKSNVIYDTFTILSLVSINF